MLPIGKYKKPFLRDISSLEELKDKFGQTTNRPVKIPFNKVKGSYAKLVLSLPRSFVFVEVPIKEDTEIPSDGLNWMSAFENATFICVLNHKDKDNKEAVILYGEPVISNFNHNSIEIVDNRE